MRNLTLLVLAVVVVGCGSPAAPPPTLVAPAEPAAPPEPIQRVENPPYTRWATFAVGTTVVFEEVTDVGGAKTTTTSTYKLTEKSDAVAVVEAGAAIVAPDGTKLENPPQALRHNRWMSKPKGDTDPARPVGTYATGTETITVRGKEYKTTWYKAKGHVEAGETDTQIWMSDDVPGAVVKSFHQIPGAKKTVTAELVEVKR